MARPGSTSANGGYKGPDDVEATLTAHISTSYETTVPNGGKVGQSASLDWSVTWKGHFAFGGGAVPDNVSLKINSMNGTVSWHGTGPDGELSCSGTLSQMPALTQSELAPLVSAQMSVSPGRFDLLASVPTAKQVESSDAKPADAQCKPKSLSDSS